MVLDAKPEAIVCRAEKRGNKFYGVVNVFRAPGISGAVATTQAIYDDDMEAIDVAEDVVCTILDGKIPESEIVEDSDDEDEPTEAELDALLEDAIEESETNGEGNN